MKWRGCARQGESAGGRGEGAGRRANNARAGAKLPPGRERGITCCGRGEAGQRQVAGQLSTLALAGKGCPQWWAAPVPAPADPPLQQATLSSPPPFPLGAHKSKSSPSPRSAGQGGRAHRARAAVGGGKARSVAAAGALAAGPTGSSGSTRRPPPTCARRAAPTQPAQATQATPEPRQQCHASVPRTVVLVVIQACRAAALANIQRRLLGALLAARCRRLLLLEPVAADACGRGRGRCGAGSAARPLAPPSSSQSSGQQPEQWAQQQPTAKHPAAA